MKPAHPAMIQAVATVREAVRNALAMAAQSLVANDNDAVMVAQHHWRSAHAAMQMINHGALLKFSTELGALIPVEIPVPPVQADAFAAGCEALSAYMDALIGGRPDQPMRLWPAYQALQRARGVEHPSQSDLFFPDLGAGPGDRADATPISADDLRGVRRSLETGLLQWLRKADVVGLQQIADAVTRVESAQTTDHARRLWWVAGAVLDALLHDGLTADSLVRRLVTQLNLQMGRLLQGPAEPPESLLREALFLLASAQPVTPRVREAQQVYGLQGALDVDEIALPTFSVQAVEAARQANAGLQAAWNEAVANPAGMAAFEPRARALVQACEALGEPALTALVLQLADTARALRDAEEKLSDAVALEGACALLMIDQVLAVNEQPAIGFAVRAQHMAARLKVSVASPQALHTMAPAQLLDETAQQGQNAQHSALVHGEIGRVLRDIELTLETWFRDTRQPSSIAGLDKPFRQAAGALQVLGHTDAAAMAERCRSDVHAYARGAPCGAPEHQSLVQRLTALSAFVDAARQGPAKFADVMASMAPHLLLSDVVSAEAALPVVDIAAVPAVPSVVPIPDVPEKLVITTPMAPAPAAEVPLDGADGTDAEMLEIFTDEADEVLATIADTVPQSRANPQDGELLTTLRRAFHTLKGSGRMVGLKHIGEAGWEMEQVFNELSAAQRPGTADIYRLVDFAHAAFSRWIAELRAHQQVRVDASRLVDYASKVRQGIALPDDLTAIPAPVVAEPAVIALLPEQAAPGVAPPALVPEPAPEPVADVVWVGEVAINRALYDIMLPEAREHVQVLQTQARRVAGSDLVSSEFLRAAHTLSGISGTAGLPLVRALASNLERVLQLALERATAPTAAIRDLITRAVNALAAQIEAVGVPRAPAAHDDLIAVLQAVLWPVEAPPVTPPDIDEAEDDPLAMSMTLDFMVRPARSASPAPAAPSDSSAADAPAVPQHNAPGMTQLMSSPDSADGSVERREYRLRNDLDAQLLPIFLEEAAELVPQVGQDLRDWRARPEDKLVPQSLKRLLHTLKGGARMAGAMALGQLTHSMESRVENAQQLPVIPAHLLDDLETSFDRIGTLIARLQGEEDAHAQTREIRTAPPPALPAAMEQMSRTMHMAAATSDFTQAIPAQPGAAGAESAVPQPAVGVPRLLMRVRADLIDRLANQAGEVSIARARVSAELRSARGSLRDLTENISRLRAQLRELEIQAETQMQSRFSPQPESTGGKFDPLEFDRFTRLQELTRLMAESVNDVATVQHNLARDLDEGEKALAAQAQTTRDVQQDLMAIRMVPFSGVTDRLFRVARLAAKENGKRVNLDIIGGHVEVDRGVIDRIVAPIEHLLRNAIVHGIEPPQQRLESGKPEIGDLRVEVRQEGNEVVLTLSDDGAGLNMERIREKAITLGLMRENERLTEQQIGNFIFRSGFSTAGAVTADAGRGVGMDVVMSEITALGGRVGTMFQRGLGTTFTIHLPLTLSVLQAVVLRLGSNYYAVPTMMVQQVQRLKSEVLAAALAERVIEWQNTRYPFHHLNTLFAVEVNPEDEGVLPYGSVILLRSGPNRAAIQVDDIVGGQEIVIKNAGPQLARVPGVTGAAVLGSGETVLILNPVMLTLRHQEHTAQSAQGAGRRPAEKAAVPERQRSVLVVDDSLTVRKITGRLLTREGYQVVVAKDGVEALEKMRDQIPDVMITDVEMPRMDGFDLTRNVRAEELLKNLPIIMITSRTAEKHRQHATELGVDVFLGKPYEEGELLGHIAALAHRAAAS